MVPMPKELRVTADVARGVFVVRALKKGESVPTDVVQAMFPDRQNDFVLNIGDGDVVLVRMPREVRYFLTISATLKVMASSNSRRSRPVCYNYIRILSAAPASPSFRRHLEVPLC